MVYLKFEIWQIKNKPGVFLLFPVFLSVRPANISFFGWTEVASCRIHYFLLQFLCFIAMHRRSGFMFCDLFQTGSESDMPGCETRWWARGGGSEKRRRWGSEGKSDGRSSENPDGILILILTRREWWALNRGRRFEGQGSDLPLLPPLPAGSGRGRGGLRGSELPHQGKKYAAHHHCRVIYQIMS